MAKTTYDARQIQVLKGLEAVRKRPAMYIGDTASRGLHHIVFEVIDNSVDEVLAGFCKNIETVIHADGSITVTDDGRGIPVDIHPQEKRPAVEVVLTTLHAGSKFGGGGYKVSGGLHGVGVSCTNALAEWLEVEVRRDGKIWWQRFERGRPTTKLKSKGRATRTGTRITFKPDPEIFETLEFDYNILARRLRELAFLTSGAKLKLVDERTGQSDVWQYKGGISSYVQMLNANKDTLSRKPIYISATRDDVEVEVAIQYNDGYAETVLSFANLINTSEGGTHVSGFRTALTRVVNQYGRRHGLLKEKDPNLSGDDVREGLCAVISVKLQNPQFEGQTKMKLGNREIEGLVNSVVGEGLAEYFEEHPTEARRIVNQAIIAHRAREAARKQAELVRRKSALESNSLPGKLWDCSSRNPEECELFLVEGDSAGGNAKQARDARFQAILPLRGKILNVEKHRLDKILSHEAIEAIISALGTGIAESRNDGKNGGNENNGNGGAFDLSKLRYHRIIIMADADVDGSHIRTLLLTFFFRYMPKLIERGHIYMAQPPLYRVRSSKGITYAWSDEELKEVCKKHPKNRMVSRFKGLSEMDPDDLARTTMAVESRVLRRVTIEDAIEADQLFTTLMGDKVEPRREFIAKHAKEVKNLDF